MSHLTRSPFHKPSPHGLDRTAPPLSPPETNYDPAGPALSAFGPDEHEENQTITLQPAIELPGPRLRKLVYQHSGIKESRDRQAQRNHRFLVVVLPPPTIVKDHGILGHTLSSGPPHRLSSGVLMSLFPTMYAQLTAIAREFNFPSITGLCLYLRYSDNGITATPRISDESWHSLWGHLYEPSHQIAIQSPVVATIEFDIDTAKARWYTSWLASSQRDRTLHAHSHSSSTVHNRPGSRSTLAEHPVDDDLEDQMTQTQHNPASAFGGRHMPRKLSLLGRLERLDSTGLHHVSASVPSFVPKVDEHPEGVFTSSEHQEPKAARLALEKVESWRANATSAATPLSALGQTSLEPVNMPNLLPLDHIPVPDQELDEATTELKLEDYTWSVSSIGPLSYPNSPLSNVSRLPSPDISRRVIEDCPLTPATATSWGAPLSYPPSPTSEYRCPSVDIACRHIFTAPVTPLTATSWGPQSWISSQSVNDYEPSIHIADRAVGSRPMTPVTATSWGAPLSYPSSPDTPSFVQTPGLMDRVFDESLPPLRERFPHLYHDILKSAPWCHVWPYVGSPFRENSERSSEANTPSGITPSTPSSLAATLSFDPQQGHTWPHVWPYTCARIPENRDSSGETITPSTPSLATTLSFDPQQSRTYLHVWPYARARVLENTHSNRENITPFTPSSLAATLSLGPQLGRTWSHVWPYARTRILENMYSNREIITPFTPSSLTATPSSDPRERSTWQHVWLYNRPLCLKNEKSYTLFKSGHLMDVSPRLAVQYPMIEIYANVYPHIIIYPPISFEVDYSRDPARSQGATPAHRLPQKQRQDAEDKTRYGHLLVTVDLMPAHGLGARYPHFEIYPPVYPHFVVYPSCPKDQCLSEAIPEERTGYNSASLLSPCLSRLHDDCRISTEPGHTQTSGTHLDVTSRFPSVSTRPPALYPHFELYPPVYPQITVYPSTSLANSTESAMSHYVQTGYPKLIIYPTVSHQPGRSTSLCDESEFSSEMSRGLRGTAHVVVKISAVYPTLEIYPHTYPWNLSEIYPNIQMDGHIDRSPAEVKMYGSSCRSLSTKLADTVIDAAPLAPHTNDLRVKLEPTYPTFDIYPAIYPDFNLYPSVDIEPACVANVVIQPRYPALSLYPSVYPYFDIYFSGRSDRNKVCSRTELLVQPSVTEIYESVRPEPELSRSRIASDASIIPSLSFKSAPSVSDTLNTSEIDYGNAVVDKLGHPPGKLISSSSANVHASSFARESYMTRASMATVPYINGEAAATEAISSPPASASAMPTREGTITGSTTPPSERQNANQFEKVMVPPVIIPPLRPIRRTSASSRGHSPSPNSASVSPRRPLPSTPDMNRSLNPSRVVGRLKMPGPEGLPNSQALTPRNSPSRSPRRPLPEIPRVTAGSRPRSEFVGRSATPHQRERGTSISESGAKRQSGHARNRSDSSNGPMRGGDNVIPQRSK